jgi:immune inhibitor A
VLDDISIPEIGYRSDSEQDDGGWQAAGWVRVTDVVPQRWYVAAIEFGATPSDTKIQTLTLDDQQQGSLTIPALGSTVKSAVLVISALAPTTTETSSYRVLARPAR